VDNVGAVGLYTSIVLDCWDIPHISYIDWPEGNLKHATRPTPGNWPWEIVDTTGSPFEGKYTSIALDSSCNLHISYTDWTNKNLMYATNKSGDWETFVVDDDGDVGLYTSIALNSSGDIYISYYDATNDDLRLATNAPGFWMTGPPVDSSGQVGLFTSIAVDDLDRVHISYYDATNHALKYATSDTVSWEIIVPCDGHVGKHTSMVLDRNGKAHISHYDVTNADLMYTTNASGDWECITVDSTGDVGWDTSITLDSSDPQNVHISYYDVTNGDLKYVTNASGDWAPETVDYSGGEYSSIALDSSENVHISYSGGTNLKYANNACTDNDGDGYGNPGHPACPAGDETDCDDTDAGRHPDASEVCDGKDNDCDGVVPGDEVDMDEDGYMVCAGDCNDNDREMYPGQHEQPFGGPKCSDLKDNDCDTFVDSEDPGCCECIDNDRDGYGLPGCPDCTHSQTDCNDTNPNVNPGAIEQCGQWTCRDGIDNDCDSRIDDADSECGEWCPVSGASTIGKTDHVNYLSLLVPFAMILVIRRRRRRA
jgi:hypothetical protein